MKGRLVLAAAVALVAQLSSAEPVRSSQELQNDRATTIFTTSERSGYFRYMVRVTDDDGAPMAESSFCAWAVKGRQAVIECLPTGGQFGFRSSRSDATFAVVWSIAPPSKGDYAIRAFVDTSIARPTIKVYTQVTLVN